MTKSNVETITMSEVHTWLADSDRSIQEIIDKTGLTSAQFYRDFRELFGCTPTEHRETIRQERRDREEKAETEEIFNFTVSLQQAGPHGHVMNQQPQRPMNAELMVPLVVNGQYGFTAYVVTTSGRCPARDAVEFLRGDYRDMFNAKVVDTILPYFHGQLNIAYLQVLNPMPGIQRPYGAWQ